MVWSVVEERKSGKGKRKWKNNKIFDKVESEKASERWCYLDEALKEVREWVMLLPGM